MASIQILDEGLPTQRYKVSYEVTSYDGSRKRKSKTFRVNTPKREVMNFKRQVELEHYERTDTWAEGERKSLEDFIKSILRCLRQIYRH